ncbi:adenosylhomocysteinase [Candidatus Desantisbacteria bacterium CG_4_10_14_0_8_um_filter_48_22]|uniref:Adenosylhomocysteinase n=1 Tax=Candidatus Desantisbacteria bacterium CG_4_10_14_0_8_um_filter_48_22 TaxID=1974543 RepID=A0A2M7S9E1_9BACT|nr:MAG: adenosylhomocysteinase [Candidatus Desantisbacteria bacterium CG1_02_49_89]PIV54474.1 MAG: adenosylhomocysteinase [Candidatus Desantisbacteria bacterium CG02_land_8_20_14_3_00_49_13]PIZ15923.1 MAG: adenosylhomocysteinase [Candidatus Desantisbacteria bacterium CG_4_10_14_0_8_um_filter_48_22]
MRYDVKDMKLAPKGKLRIEWAGQSMPVLKLIRKRFSKQKPLKGIRISACLHVTTETANLMDVLKCGGADVRLCASNPLSTQDDVASSLVRDFGIPIFAIKGEDNKTYYSHIRSALDIKPHVTMDDGADLVSMLHKNVSTCQRVNVLEVIGGTEETTTGVIRLRSMAKQGVLRYPIISVNDAQTKHLFDNRYGTGQSTIDGVLRATNKLLAGCRFVVCGYGWCGRGIAMRARGMGANVIVCEASPVRALEAIMDGYGVMSTLEAARIGEVFVTATGDINVLDRRHFLRMKDGAIVANSGHFNVELSIPDLKKLSSGKRVVRDSVEEYRLKNGKKIFLLGEGRLINLAAAEGHPASVMDMSFANQSLSVEFMVRKGKQLDNKVYPVPEAIDREIARLKLISMGVKIDTLSKEQHKYLESWEMGT